MKITMYELIGLVKDGKAPKKIKYSSYVMIYDVDENDYRTPEKDYYDADVKTYKYLTDCIDLFTDLNDYVEILDEAKEDKIQKIYHCKTGLTQNEVEIFITENLNQMVDKINELIDEINNLKEK